MTDPAEKIQPDLTPREIKDLKVLVLFTAVFCRANHAGKKETLPENELSWAGPREKRHRFCPECREFLRYAVERRLRCPLEPKPICKHCPVHCYRPGHREKVREVMRFSGKHLIRRGRLDLLWHYWF